MRASKSSGQRRDSDMPEGGTASATSPRSTPGSLWTDSMAMKGVRTFHMPPSPVVLKAREGMPDEDDVPLSVLPYYEIRGAILSAFPIVRETILQHPRMLHRYPFFYKQRGIRSDWAVPEGDIKFTWWVDKSVRYAMQDFPEAVMWVDFALGMLVRIMGVEGWRLKLDVITKHGLGMLGTVIANLSSKFLLGEMPSIWSQQSLDGASKRHLIQLEKRVLCLLEWRLCSCPTVFGAFRDVVYRGEEASADDDPTTWLCGMVDARACATPHDMQVLLQCSKFIEAWLQMALSVERNFIPGWPASCADRLMELLCEDAQKDVEMAEADAVSPMDLYTMTEEEKVAFLWCDEKM